MVRTVITQEILPPLVEQTTLPGSGAEIIFHGRVRDTEEGRRIVALEYEHYEGMAQTELDALAHEACERFGLDSLVCFHRVGRVPVGAPALRLTIRSRHRAEAISALTWFIDELKQRVPIWKWGIDSDGQRFPTPCAPAR